MAQTEYLPLGSPQQWSYATFHLTNINPNSWESLIIVMLRNLEIITFCYVPMILSLKGCCCVMLKFVEVIIKNLTEFPQLCVPILLKTIVSGGYYLFY